MQIQFEIVGIPVPKGRPRFARRGAFVSTHTPAPTRNWEAFVKHQAYVFKPKGSLPKGALGIVMEFRLPRPVSLPKKVVRCSKKPDVENLAKSVMDALEGVFYKNDSQVDRLWVTKRYVVAAESPGVVILLNYNDDIKFEEED